MVKRHRFFFSTSTIISILIVFLVLIFNASLHPRSARAKAVSQTTSSSINTLISKRNQAVATSNATNQNTLAYHGGNVMRSTSTTYAIFWEPPTLQDGTPTHVSPNYNSLIKRYFNDVGGSDFYNIATQYYDSAGNIINNSSLGDTWVDNSPYPQSGCTDVVTPHGCLSDLQIQQEVTKAMSVKGWTGGLTHLFFVFTSWGEGSCDSQGDCAFAGGPNPYCAFHYHFNSPAILYADISYTATDLRYCGIRTSPNDIDADTSINWISHEQMEAITDPVQTGWYSNGSGNREIGDDCEGKFGRINLDNGLANVEWNGDFYLIQLEWSNASNSCIIGFPAHLQVTPHNISLTTKLGTNPAPQVLTINNTGGTLNWSLASILPSWLSVTSASGSLAYNTSQSITLIFTGLNSIQTYSTQLVFSAPNTDNSPVTVSVTVEVKPAKGPAVYIGGNSSLYALNISDGSLRWRFQADGSVYSPVLVNGVLYIGGESVYAINATDGTVRWRSLQGNPFETTPAVVNGVVYIGSLNGYFYALNATDGTLLWRYQTNGQIVSSPDVANGIVYFGASDFNVYALNTTNGSLVWRYQIGGIVNSSPAVSGGRVIISSLDGYLYALNAANGTLLWRSQMGGGADLSPILANGVVYINTGNYVYALKASNGSLLWQSSAPGSGTLFVGLGPKVVNSILYTSGVYAFNASNGSILWYNPITMGGATSEPNVREGIVYAGSSDGNAYALNASNGSIVWKYPVGESSSSTPAVGP